MKKLISVLCATMLLLASNTMISANADCVPMNATVSSDAEIQAAGLITNYNLDVSNSNGQLCINGNTSAATNMKSIGFTDIQIEQSSDNKTWKSYDYEIDDVLASGTYFCSFNNRKITVTKDYYYRVTCNHYAKATGLFGKSQSISNTSNSVKIS